MAKRFDWKKKARNIPATVQVAPGIVYQITWQTEITDTKGNPLFGITDFDNKIITIRMGMKPMITVETFIHEIFHAWSDAFKIDLTEKQVLALEHIIPYLDGLFEKRK